MNENPYQVPTSDPQIQDFVEAPMTMKKLLFSFDGRVNRAKYWAVTVCSVFFILALPALLPLFTGEADSTDYSSNYEYLDADTLYSEEELVEDEVSGDSTVFLIIYLIVLIPVLWISMAVQAKRWHDRDKPGWMILIAFIPFGSFWILIECGFLSGTPGPNRYGNDPLA